ncbi:putative cell wall protein [Cocos nucifera]|uniref:Putative cell wall protein n=1 Tax=Cocos nucifera TaxID=13894 RepID=A0A8K0IVB9_COCNU|nr:putative cell wall protein [Cocos nucifera]
MACSSCLSLSFLFLLMLSPTQLIIAGRQVPASTDKKQTECLDHEGTVLIPGIGRHTIGSHEKPEIVGLDHSGPAAANGRYIPGADDTFVPNPGFEVPNPFRRSVP